MTGVNPTEPERRKSEQNFHRLVELSAQGFSVIQDFKLVYANSAYARIHGFADVNELMAAGSWMDRIPAEGRGRMDTLYRARKSGTAEPSRYERQGICKDGSLVWLDVIATVIQWEGDSAWLATMLDITERKRAEEQLRASQHLLRTIIDTLPEAVFVKDREGRYQLVNARMAEIYGLTQSAFVGRTSRELAHGLELQHAEWVRTSDREVLEQGRVAELPEMRVRPDGGEDLWQRIIKVPLRDESGGVVGLVGLREDITARKKAEEARLALERLTQHTRSLESLGAMAGGIAHDFSNLLQSILGYAELALLEVQDNAPLRQSVQMIHDAGVKAVALTRQMLALAGGANLALAKVDLNQLAAGAVPALQEHLAPSVSLSFCCGSACPTVLADANLLHQVLDSLVSNACEAMAAGGGKIVVSTGAQSLDHDKLDSSYSDLEVKSGLYGFLEVSDSGPGLPPEALATLYEPFRSTKFLGRGIGLAAVRGIVRGHRGTLHVRSAPGSGASFRILLPAEMETE